MGIQIGNGNKIKNSNIAENINEVPVTDEKKRFYDKQKLSRRLYGISMV